MARSAPRQHRRFRRTRRIFRWCRIAILLLVLVVLIAGIYLNRVGLPEFLKRPLLARLRAEGVQVDFERMRLRWYQGIVIDQATFTFLKQSPHPKFASTETELNLNYRSLLGANLKLDSLTIKNGNLIWPASATNHLTLSNVATHIRFRPHHEVDVKQFRADFIGARINVTGLLTNPAAARHWEIFQPKKTDRPKRGLGQLAATLEKIQLSEASELTINVTGDGADPNSVIGKVKFSAAAAATPWGSANNLRLSAQMQDFLHPRENNFIQVRTDSATTPWGSASNLNCFLKLVSVSTNNVAIETETRVSAKELQTEFVTADFVRFTGHFSQAWTNLVPTRAYGTVATTNAESKWGKAGSAQISFAAATNTAPKIAQESWATWAKAEPFHLTWEAHLTELETPKIKVEKAFCAGSWVAPELNVSALNAELYRGGIQLSGALNVVTREASAKSSSDFDVLKVSPFLTPFGQRWLAKYTWEQPPKVDGSLRVVLPSWTNSSPNWREEVLPTLWLDGAVSVGRGTYRAVSATSASTTFNYSNMVWTLPHIRVDRPEGAADLGLVANDQTRSYHWRIHSQIDPRAIRHLLEEKQQRVFDDFQFTTPPTIRAELRGKWSETEKTSGSGDIAAAHFSYRSNTVDQLSCMFSFGDKKLQVTEGRLDKEDKFITAKKVELDFSTKKIFFTDVYGTVDSHLVARLIGRKVAAHVAPYQFGEPPAVRLNGSMSINKTEDADMHFEVDGTRFRWEWFEADRISGRLDWVGETLLVTNVAARAYNGGRIAGWSYFNFAVTNGADYRFDVAVADVDLQSAVRSISGKTNHLEGLLHGQMTLDYGNTRDLKTWRGSGQANLRDGLIWDVPVFGIFSPVLNAVVPGSGNSRARQASARFTVADGIFYSENLEIRAPTLRLQYRGGVDFQWNIDARVEAELLRDTWFVGRFISLALTPLSKVFEYRVTGTVSNPQSEPVYIPDFLMMTLRPFNTIKKVFTPEKETPTAVPGTSAIPP